MDEHVGKGVRRGRVAALAGAAAVLVVIVAATAVQVLAGDDSAAPVPGPRSPSVSAPESGSAPASDSPSDGRWRTESFHGASVSVPTSWAVGGSPLADGGSAGLVECGLGAGAGQAYVGRPVRLTEQCAPLDPDELPVPETAYVWFGSPETPGAVTWKSGYVSETVEVAGQRITVTTDDPEERARILASARPTGPTDANGCPAVQPDEVAPASALVGEITSLSVCVYERTAEAWEIRWTGQRDPAVARSLVEAVESRTAQTSECAKSDGAVRLLVYAAATDGQAGYIVSRACRTLLVPGGALPLEDALISPWSSPAVDLYSPPLA